jgi:hypothetical protein
MILVPEDQKKGKEKAFVTSQDSESQQEKKITEQRVP